MRPRRALALRSPPARRKLIGLEGVYRRGADGAPEFVEVPAPSDEALQAVLHKIITRMMKLLTRRGVLIEEQGQTYMADNDADSDAARALRACEAFAPLHSMSRFRRAMRRMRWRARAAPRTPAMPHG